MGEEFFEAMIATTSGKPTNSEFLGYGEDEFAPGHANTWL
jgi:altronate hydrolase